MDTRLPEGFQVESRSNSEGGQATNTFNGIGTTGTLVLGVLCGLAIGMAIFAQIMANKSERETRMLEYYLLELDAKVIAAGIKKPDDAISKKLDEEKRK